MEQTVHAQTHDVLCFLRVNRLHFIYKVWITQVGKRRLSRQVSCFVTAHGVAEPLLDLAHINVESIVPEHGSGHETASEIDDLWLLHEPLCVVDRSVFDVSILGKNFNTLTANFRLNFWMDDYSGNPVDTEVSGWLNESCVLDRREQQVQEGVD